MHELRTRCCPLLQAQDSRGTLKMTGVKLKLMQEWEMHDIIDKGIRGGIMQYFT